MERVDAGLEGIARKRLLIGTAAAICSFLVLCACAATGPENVEKKAALRAPVRELQGNTGVIDVHNHLMGQYGSPSGVQDDYEGAAQVALATMEKLGITKMFIMPPPFTPAQSSRYTYEDLIGVVKRHSNRLAFLGGGGTLNVMIQQAVRDGRVSLELKGRFEKTALEVLSKGGIGFGEMTAEHLSFEVNHPYESAPPDHPLFLLLSEIAARHGVPIDLHMEAVPEDMPLPEGRRLLSSHNPKVLRANVKAFERLLTHNRNANIIWAHVGWCNTGYRTPGLCAELLERHRNLYMSFKIRPDSMAETRPLRGGGLEIKPEWLSLIRAYPERFFIGTDQFYTTPRADRPIKPPGRAEEGTYRLLTLLPPDLARKVGYENAMAVFRLKS